MANMEELYAALKAADAAGNTEDAKQLADYIYQLGAQSETKAKPPQDISFGERFKDVGAGLVSGAGALAQLPGQLSGLAGLTELDDTGLQGAGKRLQEYGQEMKSSGLKAREQERSAKIKEAEKTGQFSAGKTAFLETIKDPALLLSFLAEQAPQLIVPFGAAKGAAALTGAKALGRGLAAEEAALAAGQAGTKAAIRTGAVQQGADIGAGSYENIYKELINKGAEPADAKQSALNLARAAGASGALISLLAQRLPGASSMEKALAGVPGTGGRLAGAATAGLGEGFGEVAEETGGRLAQNLAMRQVKPEQSLTEGLGETAGMAAVGGVGMGGISGALQRQASEAMPPQNTEQEPPLALGMSTPFSPVELPDGSVATTQNELDDFNAEQERGRLAIGIEEPFVPVKLPDGSVANTREDLQNYQRAQQASVINVNEQGVATLTPEQEFENRYAPQKKRITTEAWQAMSEQEKADAVLEAQMATEPASIPEASPARLSKEQQKPIYSPEEIIDIKDARSALQDVNAQIAKAKEDGTNLFKRLKGVLTPDEVHDILPQKKKGRVGTLASKTRGAPLSSLVADGSLNEFLPPDMRITAPGQDEMSGVEYIRQAIANEDVMSFDSKLALQNLERAKEELKSRIEGPSAEREANLNLSQAAEGMADVEGLSFDDLVTYAKNIGVNTDAVVEDVASRSGDLTQEQYKGELHKGLISAVNSKSGMETLASSEKGGEGSSSIKEELQMQEDLQGKTLIQAAQYAVDKAPDNFRKFVANKILSVLKSMQAAGVKFTFDVHSGKSRSSDLYDARGLATFIHGQQGNPTSVVVLLNGTPALENQLGYPSGMNYTTLLHELLHVATRMKVNFLDKTSPEVKALNDLYNTVVKEFNHQARRGMLPPVLEKFYKKMNNALSNADELMTWGMTDIDMQSWLSQIKVGEKTLMDKFVELARKVLGISKPFETAFDRLVRTTDSILDIDVKTLDNGMKSYKYSLGPAKPKTKGAPQQQSLFSKRAQELFGQKAGVETTKLGFGKKEQAPTPTGSGVDSMRILSDLGRDNQAADPSQLEKIGNVLKSARDNPKVTAEAAKAATSKFLDRLETWTFSSDAALNNRIREEIRNSTLSDEEKIGLMLNASLSQTVHSDAVASLFLQRGGIKYNEELHKWEGVENQSNFVKLSKQLDAMAEKNGLTKQQAELVAHTAFEAKRLGSMVRFNAELEDKIATIKAEAKAKSASSPVAANALSEKAARLKDQFKFIHMTDAEIAQAMSLFKIHPELNDVVKTWNDIRDNTVKTLVDTGLWSVNEAEEMLSNADYVPFYREEQLENNQGPKDFIRGLQVQAKEKRLKGSSRPVNDIFDNQVRWVQYSINRAVRNRSALALADTAVMVGAAKQVDSRKDGNNVVRVWRNGEEQFYDMDDPMFMEAFTGLEAIVIPSWKWASDLANVLRQSVVMYPLFSVAQVPQDSFAAMFSSGLKPQYALRIPVLAVKEFIQTIRGKSKTHEELKNVGAVGVRDFTSAIVRMDAEIFAGLKAPPGILGKIKHSLNHIAMSADNAVRQAVYEASISQGVSRAEAMEKAFEVFNVRRKGSSKSLALAGQLIPFFNAYLAAQNVAYKTITGRGISPTDRQEAFKTLAATTASVMTLSLLYAMMNGDDEDYLKKPATVRDRLLMIPGTGGMSVPLRADLFTMPKIITEHMYLMMTDKGYEDGRKFRDSMAAALGSAVLGPTAVPQAIKPLVEVGINYDFFQGKPLIGTYQKKLDTERQFTDSTSELGKILGQTGLVSPIAADHLLRGMFGSVGGLVIYATNPILHSDPNSPRPSLSERDAIAALPGMGGFMTKSYESALKKDFYTLKEEVDKAANTLNDLKTRSPQEIQGFLGKEENLSRVGLQKSVNAIGERLSNIRKAISQTTNSSMPADEKERQIKILRDAEEQMLKGVDVKKLRELGKI